MSTKTDSEWKPYLIYAAKVIGNALLGAGLAAGTAYAAGGEVTGQQAVGGALAALSTYFQPPPMVKKK